MATRRFTVEILGDAKSVKKAVAQTNTALGKIKTSSDDAGLHLAGMGKAAGITGLSIGGIGAASAASSLVAAGAFAGIGVAIAGVGILAASTSQQVKNAFSGMAADAKAQFQKAAAPLVPVLTNAASQAKGIVDQQLAPAFSGAFTVLAPAINSIVSALGPALEPISGALGDIAKAAAPVIESIGDGLGPLLKGVAGFFKPITAAAADLAPVFGQVFRAVGGLLPVLGGLIAALAKAGAPLIEPLIELVTKLAKGLLDGLAPVLPDITAAFLSIIEAIGPIIPLVVKLFADLLVQAAPVVARLVEALAPIIVQLIDELAPILPQIVDAFGQLLIALSPVIVAFVQQLAPILPQLVTQGLSLIQAMLPLLPIFSGLLVMLAPVVGWILKVDLAMQSLRQAGIKLVISGLKALLLVILDVFGKILDGAASAFGWVPGIGGKLKSAQAAFHRFKDDVNTQLALINSRKTITLDVVERTTVKGSGTSGAGGTVRRLAGGGPFLPSLALVGEQGPELVRFTGAGRVTPASQTRQLLSGGSTASASRTVIELRSDGTRMGDLLVELLRQAIRTRGGDVQFVLGR